MTLAPQSASCRTQVGPERTRVRSSTVKRDRACEARGKDIRSLQDYRRVVWNKATGLKHCCRELAPRAAAGRWCLQGFLFVTYSVFARSGYRLALRKRVKTKQ